MGQAADDRSATDQVWRAHIVAFVVSLAAGLVVYRLTRQTIICDWFTETPSPSERSGFKRWRLLVLMLLATGLTGLVGGQSNRSGDGVKPKLRVATMGLVVPYSLIAVADRLIVRGVVAGYKPCFDKVELSPSTLALFAAGPIAMFLLAKAFRSK